MATRDLRPKCNYKVETKIGNFITQSNTIVLEMSGSAFFAAPPTPYLTVTGHITALQAAETLAGTRVTGSAAARNVKYQVVLKDLRSYQNFVQDLADAAADRPTAIAIIEASGFGLRVEGTRVKPVLSVQPTTASGTVKLTAKSAGKKVTYNWQMSVDNGVTYIDMPQTMVTKVLVNDLPIHVWILFRFRSLTGLGLSPWCTAVGITTE